MKLLKLVPAETKVNFLGGRRIAAVVSSLLIVASIALFATLSLNYGIDFKGGIAIEVDMAEEDGQPQKTVPLGVIRATLSEFGDVSVQGFNSDYEAIIRIERQEGGDEAQTAAVERAREMISAALPDVEFRKQSLVSATVSEELKRDGTIAVAVAVFAVLVYIWFRFEWQFGLGAVIALVHDVILTIGFFSITGLEFNLSIIAAILTIVGYSLNDTVVVYDRIRENIRRYRKKTIPEIINLSLNQTLSRTLMTSVTTLVALVSLYVFGVEAIRGFTAAMIWGVVVGTYSSVFVAAPVLTQFAISREAFYPADEKNKDDKDTSGRNPFELMP